MKPAPFKYLAPGTVEEALAALAEHGDDARPLAGGQSLVPLMNMRIARPTVLVDLNRVAGLDGVEVDGDALVLARWCGNRRPRPIRWWPETARC